MLRIFLLTPGEVPRLLVSHVRIVYFIHTLCHVSFRSSEIQSGRMGYSVLMDKVIAVHNIIPADKYCPCIIASHDLGYLQSVCAFRLLCHHMGILHTL